MAESQAERSRLSKEVNFLRGLLSAGRGPLHVRSFALSELPDGRYRYRLTVAQELRNVGATEGELRLPKRLGLAPWEWQSDILEGARENRISFCKESIGDYL